MTAGLLSRVFRMQHLMRASLMHIPSLELLLPVCSYKQLKFGSEVLHVTSCLVIKFHLRRCKVPVSLFLFHLKFLTGRLSGLSVLSHLRCHILASSSSIFLLLHDARETWGCIRLFQWHLSYPKYTGPDSFDGTTLSQ